ncbi:MAG: hypothetical protein WBA28_02785 [Microbacteriaceae bacterium]
MKDRIAHGRSLEAQLTTAKMILAQFITQISEYEAMNREQRRSPKGRAFAERMDGLREGHDQWADRVRILEQQIAERSNSEE